MGSVGAAGSLGLVGLAGLEPHPEPAAPPLLIITIGAPEMAMPAGPMSMKLPPALRVSSIPASMTTVMPALRWIAIPASWAKFIPDFS